MLHARKLLWLTAFVAATGCGGSVDRRSAEDELRDTGADKCPLACETINRCGLQGDCTCVEQPGGGDSPCSCEPSDSSECSGSCYQVTRDVIDHTPACADELLSLLNCLAGASCTEQRTPCSALADAFEDCADRGSKPTDPDVPPNPGGPPGGPSGVSCNGGFGSGSGGSPGNGPPPVGTLICESGWGTCSDGHDYTVRCTIGTDGASHCACIVSGLASGSSYTGTCPGSTQQANEMCGWRLL